MTTPKIAIVESHVSQLPHRAELLVEELTDAATVTVETEPDDRNG